MDSTQQNLGDFVDMPNADIFRRAACFDEFYADAIARHHSQYHRVALSASGPVRRVRDMYTGKIREMIYMASNDYLNLTTHPKVVQAGKDAVETYGAGAGSAPMLGGTTVLHERLEQRIAKFKSCGAAITFTSGFGSNAGTLLAMLSKRDVAIVDSCAHASLLDGCANTNIRPFRHNSMTSLERTLNSLKEDYRTKLIVVDGVYSMDGDIARLDKIVELAKAHSAYVMVDEAHATGVIGENGRGTLEHFHLEGKVDIVSGTFSKAVGVVGGFIATSRELVQLLKYYAHSYIFSTGMTPQAAGSIVAALEVIEQEPELRVRLWNNITYFREGLRARGFDLGAAETAIFPIILGDDMKVKEMCRLLHEDNVYANPVCYPAVAPKQARIRMSVMASHTQEHLDTVLGALERARKMCEGIGATASPDREPVRMGPEAV